MNEIVLTPKKSSMIPVEAEIISPNILAGKTMDEIKKLNLHVGNTKQALSKWFNIEGNVAKTPSEQQITIAGNVPHVKYIGTKMTTGKIVVKGDVGMHTGAQMSGGEILIKGNVDDWAGAEMKGGFLKIKGDSGHLLGAAYRGSNDGMMGGCIHVIGNVGTEAASFMRRGMIVIEGNTGPFMGVHMNGGEIIIFGQTGRRVGAQAKGNGGFIACLGGMESMLPTYRYETTYEPMFMKLYLLQLKNKLGIDKAAKYYKTPMKRYRGDLAIGGNAEIFIADQPND
jgi:formylmethanofuran dehydrogenase subunit C